MKNAKRVPYSSMIILDTEDKKSYSPIYSSQSYQTYYQVFARLDVDKMENNPNKVKLNSIDFELVNFKGPFQLSIKKIDLTSLPIDGEDSRSVLFIKIFVKVATSTRPRLTYEIDVDDVLDEELRYLSQSDLIYVQRELLSLYGNSYEDVPEYNSGDDESSYKGLFDTEFYARNGKNRIFKREKEKGIQDDIEINDTSASFTGGGSLGCMNSVSQVIIV